MVTPEADWCDYGDMPKSMCEHCQTGKKNAGKSGMSVERADTSVIIPATYNGECAVGARCIFEGEISKGEMITHTRKGWAHEECA